MKNVACAWKLDENVAWELDSKFIFEQTNLILNGIKNPGETRMLLFVMKTEYNKDSLKCLRSLPYHW